jgi:hypothetical protein
MLTGSTAFSSGATVSHSLRVPLASFSRCSSRTFSLTSRCNSFFNASLVNPGGRRHLPPSSCAIASAAKLKKRTLTNLYNERPAWLGLAQKKLDVAAAAAYGWPADLSDEQILERLLALNLERAGEETKRDLLRARR